MAVLAAAHAVELHVNLADGSVRLIGDDADPAEVSGYQIISPGQRIDAAQWLSLADQGLGFTEIAAGDGGVAEGRLQGEISVGAAGVSLGNLFRTGAPIDLLFTYTDENGNAFDGAVVADGGTAQASVVGRQLFYNNSSFDGRDAAATPSDDAAIAPNKQALPPGGQSSATNVSGYTKGINGVIVDLAGLTTSQTPSADDFAFRFGRSGDPSTYEDAAAPSSVLVRRGAGVGGADRASLAWADGTAVVNAWLEVTVKATANTGLAKPDVFYFGSLIADTADGGASATVNAADLVRVRNAIGTGPAGLTSSTDFNRDGRTDASDLVIVRNRVGGSLPSLNPPGSSGALSAVFSDLTNQTASLVAQLKELD